MTLDVREGEPSQALLDLYAELSRAEFGDEAAVSDARYLRWKTLANPQGASYAVSLFDGASAVGRIILQRRTVWRDGRSFHGGYLTDLLIAPSYRGVRAFMSLMAPLRRVSGFDFLYCTPNPRSLPLYRSMLRWREPFQLDAYACVTRLGPLAAKRFGKALGLAAGPIDALWSVALGLRQGTDASSALEFDCRIPSRAELDSLVRNLMASSGTVGERSPEFLRWRFADAPHTKYELEFAYRAGSLVAYTATRRLTYLGYEVLFLMDLVTLDSLAPSERALLRRRLLRRARDTDAEAIVTLVNAACRPAALGFPFARVPASLLPREAPVFVFGISDSLPGDLFEPQRCFMSPADLDVP